MDKKDAARELNIKLERYCDEIEKAYSYYLAKTGDTKENAIEEAIKNIKRIGERAVKESLKGEEREVLLSIDTVPAKTRRLNDSENPVSKWEDIEAELEADGDKPDILHYSFTLKRGEKYLPLTGQIDEDKAKREFLRLKLYGVLDNEKGFDLYFEAQNDISGKD